MQFGPSPDDNEGGNPFVNQEKLDALAEKITDVLRPIGITVAQEGFVIQDGDLILQLAGIVRDSAGVEDTTKSDREAFRQMMADNAKAALEDKTKKIQSAVADEASLEALLFGDGEGGDACDHDWHPEGICMKCGIEQGDRD